MDKHIYKSYALFLIRELSQIIDDGFGIDVRIFPCSDAGNTVIEIKFNDEERDSCVIEDKVELMSALLETKVNRLVSPLTGVRFDGTNTFVGSDSIVYVKENKEELFTEDAVIENMLTLVEYRLGKA